MHNENQVRIVEVGPRDGLQNEKKTITLSDKLTLINLLTDAGLKTIEAGAFVSPAYVPQMADSDAVFKQLNNLTNVTYSALVPNIKGYKRAKAVGVKEIAIFASASEGFSKANINCTIDEGLQRFDEVMHMAKSDSIAVRGYVSCVTDCPYDGKIDPNQVAALTEKMFNMGCYEVSLGDTLGKATAETIFAMLSEVLKIADAKMLAGHYHDSFSHALVNIKTSLDMGISVFDSSIAGLGGCPYAPGAKGNIATENVVALLDDLNYHTGVKQDKLLIAKQFVKKIGIC